jgi:hypothetical protein
MRHSGADVGSKEEISSHSGNFHLYELIRISRQALLNFFSRSARESR